MADGKEMQAITAVTTRKEINPSTIQCPMLNQTNYTVWAMRMRVLLRINKVWETIDPGSTDADKNDVATALIFQSIPEDLVLQVGDHYSPKTIWDLIKTRNQGADRVKEARLQTLMSNFEKMKMADTETINQFAGKLSKLASEATALGEPIDQPRLVKKFLNSVPTNKFIHIVASLEQVLDLKSTGFEDIVGRLKVFEERIDNAGTQGDSQGNLLFTQTSFLNTRGRGRDRGGRGNRGRGRGRGNTQEHNDYQSNQGQSKDKKDKSNIVCYLCDKTMQYFTAMRLCFLMKKTYFQRGTKLKTKKKELGILITEQATI